MEKKKYIKDVIAQLTAMLENNVINGNAGCEPFLGWLEDGDVWEELNDDQIEQRMEFARTISPIVDELTSRIEMENSIE